MSAANLLRRNGQNELGESKIGSIHIYVWPCPIICMYFYKQFHRNFPFDLEWNYVCFDGDLTNAIADVVTAAALHMGKCVVWIQL